MNVGSAAHLGESQVPRDSHFVYDYIFRRVPMPVTCYMAVADCAVDLPAGDNGGKLALDLLRETIEPAVIAEEELGREQMEPLIRDGFDKVAAGLAAYAQQKGFTVRPTVSLSMVICDRKRAYIGHVGTGKVFLLHDERLYDLTPSAGSTAAATPGANESPRLFAVEDAQAAAAAAAPTAGQLLGDLPSPVIGYNEVEITPTDILMLCTDGMWKVVSGQDLVENMVSALSLQRSASQLSSLAFSRDPSDNATVVAWQYVIADAKALGAAPRVKRQKERRGRTMDVMVAALLVLVLAGIFAVGFAFGWKITDAFRKPAKEAALAKRNAEERAKKAAEQKKAAEAAAKKAQEEAQKQASTEKTATVKGAGVRLRATPSVSGNIVGLLNDGQVVTVLEEVTGTDSKAWTKAKTSVKSGGKQVDATGYIRNDFLVMNATAAPQTTPGGIPANI